MTTLLLAELHSFAKRFAEKPARSLPADRAVWIFGAGQFGRDLCGALRGSGYLVAGFVETQPSTKQVMDMPLISWQEWSPAHAAEPLCIGIFNRGMPLDKLQALASAAGARDIYFPWDVYHAFKANLGWRFWLSEPDFILKQTDAIAKAMDCLGDEVSKRCLLDIVAFRLGLHTTYGSFQHTESQYFNPLTLDALRGKPIRFVDGGAYNGDTYLELCGLVDVQVAYLFEPDSANFDLLVTNTRRTSRVVQCLPLGLSDSYHILSFNAGHGEGASIAENGTAHIAVTSLDDILGGHTVDFIKLDVEGAEFQVLQGARRVIQRSRPVLALSLYHRPQDLWELPLALANMCEDYCFYIRQHFFNSFDSVLYAVPIHR